MIGHLLGHFQLPAVPEIFRDPRGAKAVAADFCANPGVSGAPPDHPVNVCLGHGLIGELICAAPDRVNLLGKSKTRPFPD